VASAIDSGRDGDSLSTEWPSPRKPAVRGRLARTVFSFPVMCFVLLAALLLRLCIGRIADPDLWWHLRNARYFFEHHSLPRVDMYSFGAAGSPWLNHEWLAELPYYLAFRALGLQGILLVYFVVLAMIFGAVYYRTCRAGADCKDATVVTSIAIAIAIVSIGPRTLLFGWLCMMALLLVLDHFRRSGTGLWLLPPLFAIWINLHGSWVFGIVVLVVTIVSGLVQGEWGLVVAHRWSRAQLTKLLTALVASVAALLVNPFGYRLVVYPFDFLFQQPANMKNITEWQPVDFSIGLGKLALAITLSLLVAAWFSRRRWRLDELLLLLVALWFGLGHWRLMFFIGLIVPPIIGPRLTLFTPFDPEQDKVWLNAAIMTATVAALIYFFPAQASLQQQVDDEYPKAALEFMQREHVSGPIFNSYGWGGYMEWTTPDLKPFIDGRADIFVHNGTFDAYHNATFINQPFEILKKYRIDYVLEQPKSPLSYLLEHSPGWRKTYEDSKAKLFERVRESETIR
jgi:hypothetical protein